MTDLTAEVETISKYVERFWSRVEVRGPDECWQWNGATLTDGYGSFLTPFGCSAHRYSWALHNGRFPPPGMVVRHACDNRPCTNPNHLEIGTQLDNVADMIARGRGHWSEDECLHGHPRTPGNTLRRSDGTRRCLPCVLAANAKRKERGRVR